jgi:hypothetical protein
MKGIGKKYKRMVRRRQRCKRDTGKKKGVKD